MSQVYVSKRKINSIRDFLVKERDSDIDYIMEKICSILNFDPDLKISDPKKTQRVIEWRKKIKEETGFSPYILNNMKKSLNAPSDELTTK